MIGALYACGLTPDEIREHAVELFARNGVMEAIKKDAKIASFGFSTGERLVEELKRIAISTADSTVSQRRRFAPNSCQLKTRSVSGRRKVTT